MRIYDNTLLIVDDEEKICELLKDQLCDLVATIYTAHNGEEALEVIKEHEIDIALIDLKMPKMGGLPLLEEMKKVTPNTVSIILTAHSEKEDIKTALQLGAYDFLAKPFDIDLIYQVLERGLQAARYKKTQDQLLEILLYHFSDINPEEFFKLNNEERDKTLTAVLGLIKTKLLKEKLEKKSNED